MTKQVKYMRVNGTTFNDRQSIIAEMIAGQQCILIAEPTNQYDPNAIGVWCCHPETTDFKREQIGYIPKDRTDEIKHAITPEGLICEVDEITGGFVTQAGEKAYFGVILRIEV